MAELEKIIKGLELCEIGSGDRCYETECPYYEQGCTESLKNDILERLKEQKEIIDKYSKADMFLAVHGWQWKETTTENSTNPKDGEHE